MITMMTMMRILATTRSVISGHLASLCTSSYQAILHFLATVGLVVGGRVGMIVGSASNFSWQEHVSTITKNATKKLWVLVRFKGLGGSQSQLLKVYQTRVRSTLEFAAPVFYGGLTMEQSRQIESVQKKAFAIILGRSYTSYESALTSLKQERLDTRRENLAYKFALKCTTSSRHMAMFPLNTQHRPNMRNPKPFAEPYCNTSRYYHSPIPSLSRLLNRKPRTD